MGFHVSLGQCIPKPPEVEALGSDFGVCLGDDSKHLFASSQIFWCLFGGGGGGTNKKDYNTLGSLNPKPKFSFPSLLRELFCLVLTVNLKHIAQLGKLPVTCPQSPEVLNPKSQNTRP